MSKQTREQAEYLRIAVEAQEDAAEWHDEVAHQMDGAYRSASRYYVTKYLERAVYAQVKRSRAAKTARECMGMED